MTKHKCINQFTGQGANGGSFFDIYDNVDNPSEPILRVGHSCYIVHDAPIPITWLAEIIDIATYHKGGIAAFLRDHAAKTGEDSYALTCDPA